MELFLDTTNLLISFWIGFAIVMLSLVAKSALVFQKKMLIVPLTFMALYVTIIATIDLLGRPYTGYPDGEFRYITHMVEKHKETGVLSIVLWTYQDTKHRLYKFPYSEQMKRQLNKAKQNQRKGKMQMGKIKKQQRGKLDTTPSTIIEIYDFPHQTTIPKD